MKWLRISALSSLAFLLCVLLAACGGGSSQPPAPPSPPVIDTTSLPQGSVNSPYIATLQASGGTGTYTWSISSGSLPPGLSLNPMTAAISGTPTTMGTYSFTAKVTDANNLSASQNLSLTIGGALVIDCNSCSPGTLSLPSGTPNMPYTPATISVTGGVAPYTWCVEESGGTCDNGSGGALPPGLTLTTDNNNGIISGTPTTPGPPAQFTVQVTDSEHPASAGTVTLTLTIFAVGTTMLQHATINVAYDQPVAAAGGAGPYSWTILTGSLPPGLSLTAGTCTRSQRPVCTIMGTPTQLGVFPFTIQVTDGETPPAVASQQLSIDVQGPTLQVTTLSLPDGTVRVAYSGVMQATGGIPPLTWCAIESNGNCDNGSGGALPAGLTINAGTGVISGTPTTNGKVSFVTQVQDSENPPQVVQSPTLSITVNPAITNALLTGSFAFSMNGYESGNPFVMAGAFAADGNGNLTNGFLDLNDGSGEPINGSTHRVEPQNLVAGSSYTIHDDGSGELTILTDKPATYRFKVMLSGNACVPNPFTSDCGRLIERDTSNPQNYGSGILKVQDSRFFPVASFFPGNFALLVSGTDPQGKRYAGAGALGTNGITLVDIDCSSGNGGNGWGLNSCPMDTDDDGVAGANPLNGTFSSTIDGHTGRGNFVQMKFPNDPGGLCPGTISDPACTFAYYVINKQEMIMISADPISKPANLTLWSAFRQLSSVGGWTLTSLDSPDVLELSAVSHSGNNPLADVTVGLLSPDGAGNATFNSDENAGGTLALQESSQGTYAIDATGQKTGRVTLSGFTNHFGSTPPVLYLYANNAAFVVGTDGKVTSGVLEVQSGSPFSNISLSSNYAGGSVSPVLAAVTNSVTTLFADQVGDITATQYISGPGGPGGPNNLSLTYQTDSTGRTVVMQGGNQYAILYVVGPNKLVLLPVDSTPALEVYISAQPE